VALALMLLELSGKWWEARMLIYFAPCRSGRGEYGQREALPLLRGPELNVRVFPPLFFFIPVLASSTREVTQTWHQRNCWLGSVERVEGVK
jgi:hypothetical protein